MQIAVTAQTGSAEARKIDQQKWRSHLLTLVGGKTPIIVLLLSVVVVGALMVIQWRSLRVAQLQVEHTLNFIERSRALAMQMVNGETGQRGYVITQDRQFLAPFEEAIAAIPRIFTTLREMAAENPDQITKLRQIEQVWNERAARLQDAITLANEGRVDAARDRIINGQGKVLMDDLRDRIDRLVATEQELLAQRLSSAATAESTTRWTIVAALAVAALSLLVALASALRDNARLGELIKRERETASLLEQAHARLTTTASRTKLELQDASRLLAAAVASAPLFVWSQDKNLVYRWFSGRPLGYPPERFIGRSDHEILPETIKNTVIENNQAAIESGQARSYELLIKGRRTEKWYDVRIEPTRDETGVVNGLSGVAIEITERKKREQNMRLLMREVSHRSKNILAVVQAMARQTATTTPDPAAFAERFAARLEALAATHALLVDDGWTGAEIGDLIRSQIGHYIDQVGKQIFLSGPPLRLTSEISQNIGLALHELATNAAKYGALSIPTGRVDVSWTVGAPIKGKREIVLQWNESDGPPVKKPKRKGFGQVVIERTVSRALSGAVEMSYDPKGFSWKLTFPLDDFSQPEG